MVKKFTLLTFLIFIIIYSGMAQENIAPDAANITTSHVSPWENLEVINRGHDPASSSDNSQGAYGNWTGGDGGTWNWVQYDWDSYYVVDRSEMYWWTDGGGIQIPDTSYLEYRNTETGEWHIVANHSGFPNDIDQYSVTTFDPQLTNALRYHMMSSSEATGILQWKVYGVEGEPDYYNSTAEVAPVLSPGTTSTIVATAIHTTDGPVADYVFRLDVNVINDLSAPDGIDEVYLLNGEEITSSVQIINLPPTGENGEVVFDLVIPAEIDPHDGIEVVIKFNVSGIVLERIFFIAPGLVPPGLSASEVNNTVEDDIQITFTDDPEWRARVTRVLASGSELDPVTDYDLVEGMLILKPQGGNEAITVQGIKEITVESTGYEDTSVFQEILHGQINLEKSYAETVDKLFRNTGTQIRVVASDLFGNGIDGYVFGYDIEVTDNDNTTDEVFEVASVMVSDDLAGSEMPATGNNGEVSIDLLIPAEVDAGDGISVIFRLADGTPVDTVSYHYYQDEEKNVHVQHAVRDHADFSWDRTAQSENFIIFWGANIQGDPTDQDVNGDLWFDPVKILEYSEAFYTYISDSMGFLDTDGYHATRYKIEIVMNETWTSQFTGWAFGGPVDNTTGGIWIHPGATRDAGVIVHEIGHACQGLVSIDNPGYGIHAPYGGFFWESHTEWVRSVYIPDHRSNLMLRYIMTSMMHYSTTRRYYQNFAFLDHVAGKYGFQAVNDIWFKANADIDHPLTSFRDSVMSYTQDELNDDFLESAMRNVTWDAFQQKATLNAVKNMPKRNLTRMYTIPDSVGGEPGRFIVPEYLAPGDYGYNIIPLYPDDGATEITVNFEGLENEPAGGSGSRYGFVAVDADNNARYSGIYTEQDITATFPLLSADNRIYLVVTGAPKVHHNYEWEVGFTKNYRYPYIVEFIGALPHGHKDGYNRSAGTQGGYHSNGGGWVASTATVSSTAYVGPDAQVLENASVTGNARIEGYAVINSTARVGNDAVVRGHALVTGNSSVENNALVEKTSMIYNTVVKDKAVVTGSAILNNCNLSGSAVARDLAHMWGNNLSGTAIVGGDAEYYNNISSGTYLDNRRVNDPDGQVKHERNVEVNPDWPEYHYPLGPKPSTPVNLQTGEILDVSIQLLWNESDAFADDVDYYVMQNIGGEFKIIGTAGENQFKVTGLREDTEYTFRLQAKDRRGFLSGMSNELNVSTGITSSELIENDLEGVRIYPNPVDDVVTIDVSSEGIKNIFIHDVSGIVVYKSTFTANTRIHKSEIGPPGLYLVIISDGAKSHTVKLIIK